MLGAYRSALRIANMLTENPSTRYPSDLTDLPFSSMVKSRTARAKRAYKTEIICAQTAFFLTSSHFDTKSTARRPLVPTSHQAARTLAQPAPPAQRELRHSSRKPRPHRFGRRLLPTIRSAQKSLDLETENCGLGAENACESRIAQQATLPQEDASKAELLT